MQKSLSILVILCVCAPLYALAQQEAIPLLDEVVIEDEALQNGKSTIDGVALDILPSRSGSITEALKGMSNVQYSYESDSGYTLGEIAPPEISISGAKTYENNYSIDGMGITNTLNPSGFEDSYTPNSLFTGGSSQTIFYDTHLIDSVTLYDSNIPVKYGHFVGGVVDAELKDPRTDRWHYLVEGRMTQDAYFDMDDEIDEESLDADEQPEFDIYKVSFTADGPLNDKLSALFSLARHNSIIPLTFISALEETSVKDQKRTNDNYYTRFVFRSSDRLTLKFDATYAPYEELRWKETYEDSEWYTTNDSWRVGLQGEAELDSGVLSAKLYYERGGYSRDADNNYRSVVLDLDDDSNNYNSGGLGDAEVDEREISARVDFTSRNMGGDKTTWNYSTGIEGSYTETEQWNQAATIDALVYYWDWFSTESLHTVSTYDEVDQSNYLNTLGYYLQGDVMLYRLTLTPGVRVDYDDFSHNVDIAPRLKVEYDTFGNGYLRLMAGANRYYGSSLRAYAFDRQRSYLRTQTKVTATGTTVTQSVGGDNDYSADGLDTPYSDELTTGLTGSFRGFEYSVNLVHREHKDQLISETEDEENYYLTNNGESTYDGLTITLARALYTDTMGDHQFEFSATKSRTKTFNGSYDSEIFTTDTSYGYDYTYEKVYYNGEYISRSDLPAADYNGPLILALSINSSFFNDRLRANTLVRWRDDAEGLISDERYSSDTPYGTTRGSETIDSSSWINESGGYSDAYIEGTIEGGCRTDITVEYDFLKQEMFALTGIVEVLNIFNGRYGAAVDDDTVVMTYGRGFYLGLRATF